MNIQHIVASPLVVNLDALPAAFQPEVRYVDGELAVDFSTIIPMVTPNFMVLIYRNGAVVGPLSLATTIETTSSYLRAYCTVGVSSFQAGDTVIVVGPTIQIDYLGSFYNLYSVPWVMQVLPEVDISAVETTLETIEDRIKRILGLVHENIKVEYTNVDQRHVSSVVKIYENASDIDEGTIVDNFDDYTAGFGVNGQTGPFGDWSDPNTVGVIQNGSPASGISGNYLLLDPDVGAPAYAYYDLDAPIVLDVPRVFQFNFACQFAPVEFIFKVDAAAGASGMALLQITGEALLVNGTPVGTPSAVMAVAFEVSTGSSRVSINGGAYSVPVSNMVSFSAAVDRIGFSNSDEVIIGAATIYIDEIDVGYLMDPYAIYDLDVEYDVDGLVSEHVMKRRED